VAATDAAQRGLRDERKRRDENDDDRYGKATVSHCLEVWRLTARSAPREQVFDR